MPVGAAVLALELQDHIHDVLEDLRSGDEAVLGDVADQDHRHTALLGKAQQRGRHFLDLAHGTGSGLDDLGIHRLHGVHDHQVGHHLARLSDDGVDQRLAEDGAAGIIAPEAPGAHAHLLRALLARNVERAQTRAAQRDLQAQRGLADARLAADEHQRTRHHAAAQDPVHLPQSEGNARILRIVDLAQPLRTAIAACKCAGTSPRRPFSALPELPSSYSTPRTPGSAPSTWGFRFRTKCNKRPFSLLSP
jgi:hypothetical protein